MIVIGDCAASRAAAVDAGAIPVEGFVVKTPSHRVFLLGSTIKLPEVTGQPVPYANDGRAWALADFLERFVGVRWYWPVNAGGRSVVAANRLEVPRPLQRPALVPEARVLPGVPLRCAPRWQPEKQGGMDDMGYQEPSIYRETWPDDVVAKMKALWENSREELEDDAAALQWFLYVTWKLEDFIKEVKTRSSGR